MDTDALKRTFDAMVTGGWSDFDETNLAKLQKASDERDAIERRAEAKIVADALETPAGRAFVHWLIKRTLHKPPLAAEIAATEQGRMMTIRREGQTQIVFTILEALATARGEQTQETTT